MLGLQNEREWQTFCQQVLRRPDLAADPRFASNSKRTVARDALRTIIVGTFANLTAEQVAERLDEAQIANARMNDMHDVWQHPQLQARGRWTEVGSPAGPIPALLPPGVTDGFAPRMDPVPSLGQHTDTILNELGWSGADINRLRAAGAI